MQDLYITELLLTWVIEYTRYIAKLRRRNLLYDKAEPRTIQEDFIEWLKSKKADIIADDMTDGLEPIR